MVKSRADHLVYSQSQHRPNINYIRDVVFIKHVPSYASDFYIVPHQLDVDDISISSRGIFSCINEDTSSWHVTF